MGFKILTGTDFDEDFLPRVMDLDRDVKYFAVKRPRFRGAFQKEKK